MRPLSHDLAPAPTTARGSRSPFAVLAVAAALLSALLPVLDTASAAEGDARAVGAPVRMLDRNPALPEGDWLWPVDGGRIVISPFRAPSHDYGPGHRGMDIAADALVRAPADGVIAFRGVVVDRPLLTIDHGNGLVTTIEPTQSDLAPGTPVRRGDVLGTAAAGGHAPSRTVHVGVRWNGAYINPMLLFGGAPRAVLLPCGAEAC